MRGCVLHRGAREEGRTVLRVREGPRGLASTGTDGAEEDLRLVSPAVAGGALVAKIRIVHLCAFGTTAAAADDAGGGAVVNRVRLPRSDGVGA